MAYISLILNPGSTSTKIGVMKDEELLFEETLRHSTEEIAKYASIYEQKDFRKEVILSVLKDKDFDVAISRDSMRHSSVSYRYKKLKALINKIYEQC